MDVIRVRWVDTCLRSRVSKDSPLEEVIPLFESYGVDLGITEYKGKEYQEIAYCFHFLKDSEDNVISYIPIGCIVSKEKIGEVKYED